MHLFADAVMSLAVVVAPTDIMLTGWTWIDPVAAIGFSLVITVIL